MLLTDFPGAFILISFSLPAIRDKLPNVAIFAGNLNAVQSQRGGKAFAAILVVLSLHFHQFPTRLIVTLAASLHTFPRVNRRQ